MEELEGYGGEVLKRLKEAGVQVGDVIRVEKPHQAFEGTLIPKTHAGEDEYLVIKLESGYNVGIKCTAETRIRLLRRGVRPAFKKPPIPQKSETLPRIAVITTGGTIASRVDYRTGGVEPALGAEDLYSIFPELSAIAQIEAQVLFSEFSENITAEHYGLMARSAAAAIRSGAQGVVICHGTDTLGYTSAALSFALRNLPAPVVLVGSQRSSDRPSSDAATNLIGAVDTAAQAPFAEVCVAMHETLSDQTLAIHIGTKVRKCHTSARSAFKSVNAPLLARSGISDRRLTMVREDYRKRGLEGDLKVEDEFDERVALLKFYPGMSPDLLEWHLDRQVRGVIIEGSGLGHVSKPLQKPIERAALEGVFVGMTSQCLWGRVNMQVYSTGRDLLRLGVTPLEDMLPET
ncbi:MAG: Glu-tRNA(Gln) amidotransferase subunit GatD, partial [Candidatus Bathyarchaeia archaeon]